MCRFIETICWQEGHYPLLHLHQQRVEHTFAVYFPRAKPHLLADILPDLPGTERYRVRVVYDALHTKVEHTPHTPRAVRSIYTVRHDRIDYAFKYENRSELRALYDRRGDADEILIIKNGRVTDSFFANPVFWDASGWYVPDTYLLNGVRRQQLLEEGRVQELTIRARDLKHFSHISLVNALYDLGEVKLEMGALKGL